VSLVDRTYPDVVRDLLTTLTGGVVAETQTVVYAPDALPNVKLLQGPVKRVSFISGKIAARSPDAEPIPYVFGLTDYELVSSNGAGDKLDTIHFLPFGKRPVSGTTVTINYYPRTAAPSVITDVNVGSVARTLLEAVATEIASLYGQLNIAYDSGFVETAKGAALDRVVALLGYKRFRAGRAVGTVTFRRRPGSPGDVTIPAGTPVTDTQDKIRYETTEAHVMLDSESVALVRVQGSTAATPTVEEKKLTVIARAVAGLSEVTNEKPTARASEDESDDDLRLRIQGALALADKGTVEAMRHGLLQMAQVRDVKVVEMPNGVPGEIALTLSLEDGKTILPAEVAQRIEQLRPAGIRIAQPLQLTTPVTLTATIAFLYAGSSLQPAEMDKIESAARDALVAAIKNKGIGELIRIKPLAASILGDARIIDVDITLSDSGAGTPNADFKILDGKSAELKADDVHFSHTFAEAAAGTASLDVSASMKIGNGDAVQAKSEIRPKLEAFFAGLHAGDVVDAQKLLDAVRGSGDPYGIDPLTFVVTIGSGATAVPVAMAAATFPVAADQTFRVVNVEVTS
jgi:uncharacterized phage protein gp47/JayE